MKKLIVILSVLVLTSCGQDDEIPVDFSVLETYTWRCINGPSSYTYNPTNFKVSDTVTYNFDNNSFTFDVQHSQIGSDFNNVYHLSQRTYTSTGTFSLNADNSTIKLSFETIESEPGPSLGFIRRQVGWLSHDEGVLTLSELNHKRMVIIIPLPGVTETFVFDAIPK